MYVLICCDAADGRLVHADRLGHIPQYHRLEVLDPFFKEIELLLDDALCYFDDGSPSLINGTLKLIKKPSDFSASFR